MSYKVAVYIRAVGAMKRVRTFCSCLWYTMQAKHISFKFKIYKSWGLSAVVILFLCIFANSLQPAVNRAAVNNDARYCRFRINLPTAFIIILNKERFRYTTVINNLRAYSNSTRYPWASQIGSHKYVLKYPADILDMIWMRISIWQYCFSG